MCEKIDQPFWGGDEIESCSCNYRLSCLWEKPRKAVENLLLLEKRIPPDNNDSNRICPAGSGRPVNYIFLFRAESLLHLRHVVSQIEEWCKWFDLRRRSWSSKKELTEPAWYLKLTPEFSRECRFLVFHFVLTRSTFSIPIHLEEKQSRSISSFQAESELKQQLAGNQKTTKSINLSTINLVESRCLTTKLIRIEPKSLVTCWLVLDYSEISQSSGSDQGIRAITMTTSRLFPCKC